MRSLMMSERIRAPSLFCGYPSALPHRHARSRSLYQAQRMTQQDGVKNRRADVRSHDNHHEEDPPSPFVELPVNAEGARGDTNPDHEYRDAQERRIGQRRTHHPPRPPLVGLKRVGRPERLLHPVAPAPQLIRRVTRVQIQLRERLVDGHRDRRPHAQVAGEMAVVVDLD